MLLSVLCDWVSMSEPHTSAFNVEICLYGTYAHTLYVAASAAGLSGHSYHTPLLPPGKSIVLPHSVNFIKQVCPTVRLCLSNDDR